jgi:hypothetical protein
MSKYYYGVYRPTGGSKFAGDALGAMGEGAYMDRPDESSQKRILQMLMTLTNVTAWVI